MQVQTERTDISKHIIAQGDRHICRFQVLQIRFFAKASYNQFMKILGIVSEYNPFHNGHAEQLRVLRERFSADAMFVTCMSGDFVQRGEAALLSKWRRAEAAMASGVNLVLELDSVFSCSSADYFAAGAVRTLAATGLPLTLCFGSESGQLKALQAVAKLRRHAPGRFNEHLRTALQSGRSYAAAHEAAARSFILSAEAQSFFLPDEQAALFEVADDTSFWHGSNNQLALAYLAALENLGDLPRPQIFTHKRRGGAYLDEALSASHSSATAVRRSVEQVLPSCAAALSSLRTEMPTGSLAVLLEAIQKNEVVTQAMLVPLLFSRLRASSVEELATYHGWDEGLPERVKEIVASRPEHPEQLYQELVDKARSRRFPAARVQRALISLLVGIKKNEVRELLDAGAPFYIRALAADKSGRYLLRRMRKSAHVPLFTKTSDYLEIPATEPLARRSAEISRTAADIYAILMGAGPGADFDKPMLLG